MFKQITHINIVHVPYKGAAPAITDVAGGQVQLMFSTAPPALPLIQAKKLRAIGVSGSKRYKGLPDVPSAAEQGYPEFNYVAWNGIHAPAKTPPAILEKLAAKISEIMRMSDARERAEKAGFDPVVSTLKEFQRYQVDDLARIATIIRGGNIKAD
jgi:tripartite-type tricarboxylate transporter receptor subunit TctC